MASTAGFSKRHYKRLLEKMKDRMSDIPTEENRELETANVHSYCFIDTRDETDNIDEIDSDVSDTKPDFKEHLANWVKEENISYVQPANSSIATTVVSSSSDTKMIAEFKDLKEAVKAMQNTIQAQTSKIAEQSLKINSIYEKLFCPTPINIYDFPIKTLKDLEDLDGKIKSESQFEADLKIFLSLKIRGKVGKDLNMLISDDFLSEINWNGRKKMTAMKRFRFFESTLYSSIHNLYKSYEDYEEDIKKAIKKGKNRIDQRKHQIRRIKKHI